MGIFTPLQFIITKELNNSAWVPPPGFGNAKGYPIKASA